MENFKPRVLMYGWEFPPEISGGLGMACYGIVNELAKKGLSIQLVLPKSMSNITGSSNVAITGCNNFNIPISSSRVDWEQFGYNVNVHQIETLLHPYINEQIYRLVLASLTTNEPKLKHDTIYKRVMLTGKYGPNLLSEVFRYAEVAQHLAKKIPHDIIHAHDWLTGLAGVEAKRSSGKPLVFQVHALEYDRCGEYVDRRIFAIEKYVMEKADLVIAVSQYTKNVIITRYHIDPEKIHVVHNGTYHSGKDPESFRDVATAPMVLFVGRITHQKGPWYFIEVAKKILSFRPDVEFVIAGSGDTLVHMIERVADLRIGKNVHFTGFLSQEMVKKLYQHADVYVMPSVSEPFGLTCLEALALHIPVVISKQSGASEVLPHVLKADFWDTHDMAEKILALLEYRALREDTMHRSLVDIKGLTWEHTAQNLISVYQKL